MVLRKNYFDEIPNMVAGITSAYATPQVQRISQSEVSFENEFRGLNRWSGGSNTGTG